MRRIALPPRRQFVAVAVAWVCVGALAFVPRFADGMGRGGFVLLALLNLLLLWLTLVVFLARAVVTDKTLTFRSLNPRKRLRAEIGQIVRYRADRNGDWWVETAERSVRPPVAAPWELHAAMVEVAPTKLGAKRLKAGRMPPTEEFRGLWMCDVDLLLSETLSRIVVFLPLVFLTRRIGGAVALLVLPLAFRFYDIFSRMDVTREGIVERGPFHRRSIPWGEATAIFCERGSSKRSFVVTSGATAIEIPDHLAQDLDLMQKVFSSLPDGALCVNFDETTFRGYRRREERKEKVRSGTLLPALTD